MKTDKINFTGFKNVGAVTLKMKDPQMPYYRKMIIELTDDGLKHLTYFKKMLAQDFPFAKGSNKLHLDVFEFSATSAIGRSNYLLSINSKPVEATVKNIKILDKIADLTSDIAEADIQELHVSKSFLEEPGRIDELTKNKAMKFNIGDSVPIEDLYGPKNVKTHGDIFCSIFDSYGTSIIASSN